MTRALGWLAAGGCWRAWRLGFGSPPREAMQGNVQRIMYLHVPSVLTAYLAFGLVLLGSVAYLATPARRLGPARGHGGARSACSSPASRIVTGSSGASPPGARGGRGTRASPRPRCCFCVYLGYLLLRSLVDDPERAAATPRWWASWARSTSRSCTSR